MAKMYALKIDGKSAKEFESFRKLIDFLVPFTFDRRKTLFSGKVALCDVGQFDLFGYRGYGNIFLDGYNRTGKDTDRNGGVKRFSITDGNGVTVDQYDVWNAVIRHGDRIPADGYENGRWAVDTYDMCGRLHKHVPWNVSTPVPREKDMRGYRGVPVPYTGRTTHRKRKTSSYIRTMRLLSDPEYGEYGIVFLSGDRVELKERGEEHGWKDHRVRHQWQRNIPIA